MAFGGIIFAIFAKGEELPWAKQTQDDEQEETDNIHHIQATGWGYDWCKSYHMILCLRPANERRRY